MCNVQCVNVTNSTKNGKRGLRPLLSVLWFTRKKKNTRRAPAGDIAHLAKAMLVARLLSLEVPKHVKVHV
eukprot:1153314-Pelagomonas_calceolata.AAC.1